MYPLGHKLCARQRVSHMIIGSTPTHPPLTLPFVGTYVSLINSTGITRGEDDDDELDNQRRKGWVDSNRLEVGNIAFIMALSRQIIGRGKTMVGAHTERMKQCC